MGIESRRRFLQRSLVGASAPLLAACQKLSDSEWFARVLATGETLSQRVSLAIGRRAMAQEFTPADLSPTFRSNGTAEPDSDAYRALVASNFQTYALAVGGLVESPRTYTLNALK